MVPRPSTRPDEPLDPPAVIAVASSACDAPSKRTSAATARAAKLGAPSPAAAPSFGCTRGRRTAEDGADDEWSREADGHSSAVLPWPDGCRILMIVGATGSGKTRLLRSLAGCAASLRSRPRWPSGRSILDGLGADGAHWLKKSQEEEGWCGRAAVRRAAVRRRRNGGAATAVRRRRSAARLCSSSLSPLALLVSISRAPFASGVAAGRPPGVWVRMASKGRADTGFTQPRASRLERTYAAPERQ